MTTWSSPAAAKLNLTLEVRGKREDGFHDLGSVVVSLDLADEVRLSVGAEERSISYRDDAGRRVSIETSDDIVLRAWSLLQRHCRLPSEATVEVTKRIPVTSGLGGGSTDAAAFLRLARAAWQLDLSDDDLLEIGAQVGSDVPVCLIGGPVLMEGRGERVTPIQHLEASTDSCAVLLHRAEIPVPAAKTATMYRALRTSDFRSGDATNRLVERLRDGATPIQDDCVNSFDVPAREVMQGLTRAWRAMGSAIANSTLESGEQPVVPLLAGAGPTLFALLSERDAQRAASQLRAAAGFTCVARVLGSREATTVRPL
ncbi:MAG: 4-(cytidine 5'-diphospho)-2-C-methyl-D-erythritol kinase [Chloroflexi bacterium]|nr:4-(cytidine 5'-diphospho)-2-C-methyl-D-erythritol kinase [Chloroflexota bacterium]MYD17586.1 4-(cytidine 5'-diphospho)-2-C-methyl-D-erythritol kinase [Chloroflexota bacterium]MYJ00835.1 4-(cytidine 5'-diphospho)-2-C-methyl-D-erythritol kinase [Chloroflexota bacterium]